MKKFLPLIIIILIATIFAVLAFYTSDVIEGNTNMNVNPADPSPIDCEFSWGEWGDCNNFKQTRTLNITKQSQNGGQACPTKQSEERFCATSSGTVNLATSCTRPSDLTGYEFATENPVKSTFEIGGLKCAKDYYGNPTSEACSSVGTPYSLKGCHRIIIEASNTDHQMLLVNFSKPIVVQGSPGDLKNNFQYRIVPSDTEFKKVSDAIITSNNQIKLKLHKEISQGETILVKYEQNKTVSKGGAELMVDDSKLNTVDQISVVNSIVDTIAPKLQTIAVEHSDPNKIKILFNEPLKDNETLDINDFEITINNRPGKKPNKVVSKNNTLTIHLREHVSMNDSVKFQYKIKSTDAANHVKDLHNNTLLNIESINVTNNVGYPDRTIHDVGSPSRETSVLEKALNMGMAMFKTDDDSTMTESEKKKVLEDIFNLGKTSGSEYYKSDAYYNNEYVKSMGAHNPFNFINEKNNINCKIDPTNKNKAICDLERNKPIQPLNMDSLKDNRGDEKDKYILKTKIVPVVNPRCPTCLDEDDIIATMSRKKVENKPAFKKVKLENNFSVDNPLELNKSISKILDVQENLKLDKYNRSIKPNTGIELNENIPNINMPELNPSVKTPQLNPNFMKRVEDTVETATEAAKVVNIDPRFINENIPTQNIHELGNIKTNNPSSGFIPRLTSFSSF